jgi:hypothetical protein
MKRIGEKGIHTPSLPIQTYKDFIRGEQEIWSNIRLLFPNNTEEEVLLGLQEIDYDEVTTGLRDIISEFYITLPIDSEDLSRLNYDVRSDDQLILNENDIATWDDFTYWKKRLFEFKSITSYISTRQPYYKCYTIDAPMIEKVKIREISMRLNTSIFSYGLSSSQFHFYLTYPKQFLRTPLGNRIALPLQIKNAQCYKLEIHLGPIKVLRRRDKRKEPCNEDLKHHDEKQLNAVFEKTGCKPRHWKIPSALPNFSIPKQYSDFNDKFNNRDENFMAPCRSIEKLAKEKVGTAPGWMSCRKTWLDLKVYLDGESYYEEVIFLPAYTFQSLIGNTGRITRAWFY